MAVIANTGNIIVYDTGVELHKEDGFYSLAPSAEDTIEIVSLVETALSQGNIVMLTVTNEGMANARLIVQNYGRVFDDLDQDVLVGTVVTDEGVGMWVIYL